MKLKGLRISVKKALTKKHVWLYIWAFTFYVGSIWLVNDWRIWLGILLFVGASNIEREAKKLSKKYNYKDQNNDN